MAHVPAPWRTSPAETALVIVLRGMAALLLAAVVPAVMPFAWMAAVHDRIGLVPELPDTPLVNYLTRSLSLIYAMHGAILWFVSLEVRRWLPVVKCLAVLGGVFGASMFALDYLVRMPPWWVVGEGPFILAASLVVWRLAGRVAPTA